MRLLPICDFISGGTALRGDRIFLDICILRIVPVDDEIIRLSLQSKYRDFEVAIQYYAALRNRADYLITRNTKDYRKPALNLDTPGEFLAIKGG